MYCLYKLYYLLTVVTRRTRLVTPTSFACTLVLPASFACKQAVLPSSLQPISPIFLLYYIMEAADAEKVVAERLNELELPAGHKTH